MKPASSFLIALALTLTVGQVRADTVVMSAQLITSAGSGGVAYVYGLGTYDITNAQYTAFLNTVAATDTYNLYNPSMGTDNNSKGIARSGSPGSYVYSVIGSSGNHPVTYVSWFDAARMANWMNNGQPSGGEIAGVTETGAYTLNGATTGNTITTNSGANYYIPSVAEWRKAAFYDPTLGGNWLYPTRSNTAPGNHVGNLANQANITVSGSYSVTQSTALSSAQDYLTDVGAFTNSASYYGTYDQAGLVWEITTDISTSARKVLGGAWTDTELYARNNQQGFVFPTSEFNNQGFRLATSAAMIAPEPSTLVLLGVGGLVGIGYARHRRRAAIRSRRARGD